MPPISITVSLDQRLLEQMSGPGYFSFLNQVQEDMERKLGVCIVEALKRGHELHLGKMFREVGQDPTNPTSTITLFVDECEPLVAAKFIRVEVPPPSLWSRLKSSIKRYLPKGDFKCTL